MYEETKYYCDFCNEDFEYSWEAEEHEKDCRFNPELKACKTCEYEKTVSQDGNLIFKLPEGYDSLCSQNQTRIYYAFKGNCPKHKLKEE